MQPEEITVEQALKQYDALLWKLARRYLAFAGDANTVDDLRQEAALGLIRAVRTYDAKKGASLFTWVHWWARHYVQRYVRSCGRTIRIPENQQIERTPNLARVVRSLDEPLRADVELTLAEVLTDKEAPAIDEMTADRLHWQAVMSAADKLRPRRRTILFMYFLGEQDTKEIAAHFGVSHQAIQQQLALAIAGVKKELKK